MENQVSSFMATSLGQAPVQCAADEFQRFFPPTGQTCAQYMQEYISQAGGYLDDPNSTDSCSYCQLSNTNEYLARIGVSWDHRWRDFGLLWVFIVFNVAATLFLYWLCRVPKGTKKMKKN